MEQTVSQCVRLIQEAKTIAALTGAGISTKAGIPDFRGPQGLYVTRRYDPDRVFDIQYFYRDPKPFYEFARDFMVLLPDPPDSENGERTTFAHHFLADLEKSGKLKGIVTQNIDSLHQMAGSKNVYEMHGSFWVSHCLKCGKEFSFAQMKKKLADEEIPHCGCGGPPRTQGFEAPPFGRSSPFGGSLVQHRAVLDGVIKPDIVFFGENVKFLTESAALAGRADLFFVIGTSCVVYPAALIPHHVRGKIVVVNMDPVHLGLDNVALNVQQDIDTFFNKVEKELFTKTSEERV